VWRAYVDESQSNQATDPGVYLFAAALVHDDQAEAIRTRFETMRRPGGLKLHWYDASEKTRRNVMRTVADIEAMHVIVIRTSAGGVAPERQRRKCLEHLAFQLAHTYDVRTIVAEARDPKANNKERAWWQRQCDNSQIPADMRLEYAVGKDEPLLWIADAVAGAHVAHRTGVSAEWWTTVHEVVDVIETGDMPQKSRES